MIQFLKKPFVLWGAFLIAGIIATYFPSLGLFLKTPSEIYLSLLEMCVTPLLMTSLILAISSMVSFHLEYGIARVIGTYLLFSFILTVFIIGVFSFLQIGSNITDDPKFLDIALSGETLTPILITLNDKIKQSQNFLEFLRTIFTSNIFYSLYNSSMLQIIFFSMIIGAASGLINKEQKKAFIDLMVSLVEIFKKMISWIMLFLPIGVICIFSSNFIKIKPQYIEIFVSFIFVIIFLKVFIILSLNFILAKKMNMKYFEVLNKIKQTLFIAVSTSSIIATMPIYMQTLEEKFGFESNKIQLFVPVTLITIRFSYILYFAALTMLAIHIFSIPLSLGDYITLPFLIIFGSFAAVSSGIININILSMILQPLGVPSSLLISIFSVLDPLFDPFRMIFSFYMNFFTLVYSLSKKDNE